MRYHGQHNYVFNNNYYKTVWGQSFSHSYTSEGVCALSGGSERAYVPPLVAVKRLNASSQ